MQTNRIVTAGLALLAAAFYTLAAPAADRATYKHFLEVTGFDIAITSMQQSAMDGPGIAGDAPDAFGIQYTRLAEKVFDPQVMLDRAIGMMQAAMPDDLVDAGIAFYGSDLGQRLVAAENQSHMTDDATRYAAGQKLLAKLTADDPARIDDYSKMMDAIGGVESSVRAVIEIQVRYLMASMAAGDTEIDYSEKELRALMQQQAPKIRKNIAVYSMLGTAYAYRDFSDADVHAYTEALQSPKMRQVYELLNGIQFEVMAERYEVLAGKLAGLSPGQDL